MRTLNTVIGLCFLGIAFDAFGHGLVQNPPSRTWYCGAETRPDHITNNTAKFPVCSTAFAVNQMAAYNYMAVVTHNWGRAKVTPLPKNVCGFDGESWQGAKTPWDAAMEWPTTRVDPGPLTLTWDVTTGPHFDDTHDFSYWITKSSFVFSPTRELTWDDFETQPFCVLEYDDKKPTANPNITTEKAKSLFHTKCTIPSRTGHHVIYGEWGRTEPTKERFHSCIDIAVGTAPTGISAKPMPAAKGPKVQGPTEKQADMLGRLRGKRAVPTPTQAVPR